MNSGHAQLGAPVEYRSAFSFSVSVERISLAIRSAGMKIFATIDHAAAAAGAGLRMPPSVVITYGNPVAGTQLMLLQPLAALDLPLRLLVRARDDGCTFVSFHPIVPVLSAVGVPEAIAERLGRAQLLVVQAVLAEPDATPGPPPHG